MEFSDRDTLYYQALISNDIKTCINLRRISPKTWRLTSDDRYINLMRTIYNNESERVIKDLVKLLRETIIPYHSDITYIDPYTSETRSISFDDDHRKYIIKYSKRDMYKTHRRTDNINSELEYMIRDIKFFSVRFMYIQYYAESDSTFNNHMSLMEMSSKHRFWFTHSTDFIDKVMEDNRSYYWVYTLCVDISKLINSMILSQ